MKKLALATVATLSLSATPVFACPEEGGGDSMRKTSTSEKTKAKPDAAAKDSTPKGGADSAGGTTQKDGPKPVEKKPS